MSVAKKSSVARASGGVLPRATGPASALFLSLSALACGQDPPPAPVTGGSYHPLVDGARWEYEHDDWTETVTLSATTFDDAPAFLMSDSPNPKDDLRADSIIVERDGVVARMTKDEYLVPVAGDPILQSSVTYGVGFTRFREDWTTREPGYTEQLAYIRVETPPGGSPLPGEDRSHTFEVMDLSDEVVTAIGTFDCIKIRRVKDWQAIADGVDLSDAQTKVFWFARGVGKVREENEDTGSFEQLSDYDIPD